MAMEDVSFEDVLYLFYESVGCHISTSPEVYLNWLENETSTVKPINSRLLLIRSLAASLPGSLEAGWKIIMEGPQCQPLQEIRPY